MNISECEAGKSYACHFQVATFINSAGVPVLADLPTEGRPGLYKGFGVIVMRDLEQRLVKIRDLEIADQEFTVSWDDCWDVDEVEWRDP